MDIRTGDYVLDEVAERQLAAYKQAARDLNFALGHGANSDHDSGMAVDLQDGTHVVKIHGTAEQMRFISLAVKEKRRRQAKAARKSRRRNR